jgi:hypothetical protein
MKSGLKVKAIWFENGDGVKAGNGQRLLTLNEDHGEYNDDWVTVVEDSEYGDKEIARHNTRYIVTIIFE